VRKIGIGMTRLVLILWLILSVCVPSRAQVDSTVFLESNTPVVLRLAGNGQPVEAFFAGEAGQIVTIIAQAADPAALDLVLEWVSPTGERAAYNDDWAGERTEDFSIPDGFESLAASDSALIRLILHETGTYSARVNTFNGEGVGDFSLTVSLEPSRAGVMGESTRIGLHRAEIAALSLELSAGQTVTVTSHDPRGRLDNVLDILSPDGERVASNDDHHSDDVTLNRFDSRLTFTATAAGTYVIQVRDFLGRAGVVTVSLSEAP